jgi:hypothetical protein
MPISGSILTQWMDVCRQNVKMPQLSLDNFVIQQQAARRTCYLRFCLPGIKAIRP